ncbi:TetR family transcriptional regulator [Streptomyces sp. NPDC016845]|uniref:TetR family transcriptional regulator n=1 Tax=Streptomyces sp. NPDC016845 TaxID=3364972 RepID=UPI0037B619B6
MPRWMPEAKERLRDAAIELSVERGYENVTVTDITERAGLARRTFSRYFTDKRDAFFADSERLAETVGAAAAEAHEELGPWDATVVALRDVGDRLVQAVPTAGARRAVIRTNPELQERERTKLALIVDALAEALRGRGTPTPLANMLAQVGVAASSTAFELWLDDPDGAAFRARFDAVLAEFSRALES